MALLTLDQQRIIHRAIEHPGRIELQLREARRHLKAGKSQGESGRVVACVGGVERFIALTEALWDYLRDRESIY